MKDEEKHWLTAVIPYRAGVILADFFYSLPCLHVSILRKDNDGNDFKDGNIAWEGGSGVITDFLEREALIQKKFLNRWTESFHGIILSLV